MYLFILEFFERKAHPRAYGGGRHIPLRLFEIVISAGFHDFRRHNFENLTPTANQRNFCTYKVEIDLRYKLRSESLAQIICAVDGICCPIERDRIITDYIYRYRFEYIADDGIVVLFKIVHEQIFFEEEFFNPCYYPAGEVQSDRRQQAGCNIGGVPAVELDK